MLRTSLDAENEENVSGRIAQNSTQGSITQRTCAVTFNGVITGRRPKYRIGFMNCGLRISESILYGQKLSTLCRKNTQLKERKKENES